MTTATKTATLAKCACGCGRTTKARYAPGHDARHVSQLLAKINAKEVTLAAAKKQLSTEALQAKLTNAIANATEREAAKAERAAAKAAAKTAA